MKPYWFRQSYHGRFAYVLAHLPFGPLLCLDVGNIGEGFSSHELIRERIEAQGGTIVGCDLNLLGCLRVSHTRQVVGDVRSLPFSENVFDMVYLGELIEHLWEPRSALLEIQRVLKMGGWLLLDTPHVYALGRLVRWVCLGRDDIGDPDHKLFFTPAILANLLEKTGFDVRNMCTDRKWQVSRLRLPWVPWGRRLGSHLLLTAVKV